MQGSTVVRQLNGTGPIDSSCTPDRRKMDERRHGGLRHQHRLRRRQRSHVAVRPRQRLCLTLDNLGRTLTVDNAGTPNVPHVILTEGYDSASDRTSLSATINGTADFLKSYFFDADQRLTDETQVGQNGGNGVAQKQLGFYYFYCPKLSALIYP